MDYAIADQTTYPEVYGVQFEPGARRDPNLRLEESSSRTTMPSMKAWDG
jgi:hypothetical protein